MENGQNRRVSVIIPTYNREAMLAQAIDSVLAQDYHDFELIVVDDGSTDGSYQLVLDLEKIHDFSVLTHRDRTNCGQSASINLGLEACSGDFIAILDSDDLFLPGKLSSQVKFLEENPDVDLVYGKGQAIDSNGIFLYDILDQRLLLYSTFATLPVTLGLLAGQRLRSRISEARFHYLIIGILVISGASMLWRAYQ